MVKYNSVELVDKSLDWLKNVQTFRNYFDGPVLKEVEGTYYALNAIEGIEVVLSNYFLLQSIHLFSANDDVKECKGEMPFGLRFSMSKDIDKFMLGEPKKSWGGYTDIFGPRAAKGGVCSFIKQCRGIWLKKGMNTAWYPEGERVSQLTRTAGQTERCATAVQYLSPPYWLGLTLRMRLPTCENHKLQQYPGQIPAAKH